MYEYLKGREGNFIMIYIYSEKKFDKRFQNVVDWLDKYGLEHVILYQQNVTRAVIIKILSVSDGGFSDIVIPIEKMTGKKKKVYRSIYHDNLSVHNFLDSLVDYPMLLKTPIIFDDTHLMTGFDEYEIRKFLPREYRKEKRGTNR